MHFWNENSGHLSCSAGTRNTLGPMFVELDSIKENNPKGYIDLIKTVRDGTFDKDVVSDTSHISPQEWFRHFSELLSKNVESKQNDDLDCFIKNNWDIFTPV